MGTEKSSIPASERPYEFEPVFLIKPKRNRFQRSTPLSYNGPAGLLQRGLSGGPGQIRRNAQRQEPGQPAGQHRLCGAALFVLTGYEMLWNKLPNPWPRISLTPRPILAEAFTGSWASDGLPWKPIGWAARSMEFRLFRLHRHGGDSIWPEKKPGKSLRLCPQRPWILIASTNIHGLPVGGLSKHRLAGEKQQAREGVGKSLWDIGPPESLYSDSKQYLNEEDPQQLEEFQGLSTMSSPTRRTWNSPLPI